MKEMRTTLQGNPEMEELVAMITQREFTLESVEAEYKEFVKIKGSEPSKIVVPVGYYSESGKEDVVVWMRRRWKNLHLSPSAVAKEWYFE